MEGVLETQQLLQILLQSPIPPNNPNPTTLSPHARASSQRRRRRPRRISSNIMVATKRFRVCRVMMMMHFNDFVALLEGVSRRCRSEPKAGSFFGKYEGPQGGLQRLCVTFFGPFGLFLEGLIFRSNKKRQANYAVQSADEL